MAESGISALALEQMIGRTIELSINRDAAAALTVAFEIRKAISLYKGENMADTLIRQEIEEAYIGFQSVTNPKMQAERARQTVGTQKKP